ncbi:GNAT family acetyltransferase [Novosphingobium taihuense]|uniref:Ribosomal protein S18 acetylase RimI-like enzyme n=1 Tax=Novosphingobium taihuense TaxID=260085 RepID=A0A7W7AAS0_9SPHN|nr:GNAT family acetyltransferase [Novosphingobium taihuense]MBB4612810.1 ribosomal protein S18 acetylase RimI-like enzyme [Novosphingobium taihuense]TWH80279.1 ribosomal protein S18 acetylase RimI-like enzyme [Novosphingobium taihuense]
MGVSIRAATAADREATVGLWEAAGLTRPWNDPRADFDLALATLTSTVLLADDDDALIGSVMVGLDGHRGWVYYLATAPDRRGQGVGRTLMSAAEDWLKTLGSPKIQLMVRGDNAMARGFYAALGYELQEVVTLGKRLQAT